MTTNSLWKSGRLADAVQSGPPVVFVCAPAGYGKSSLIRAYADTSSAPVAWVAADIRDAEPAWLVSHLGRTASSLAASAITIPVLGNPVATMIGLSEAIGNQLVVIDDAHLIVSEQTSTECLNELIAHRAKAGLPLIVTARKLDNLRVSNWLMNGSASVLGVDDISWTERETGDYLLESHGLSVSPAELQHIHGLADGWPICVSLLARVKLSQPSQSWESTVENAATSPNLEQYLTDEVIGSLGHEVFEGLVVCAQEEEIALEILLDSGLVSEDTWNMITEAGLVTSAGSQACRPNRFVMHQLIKSHIQTIASQPSSKVNIHEILHILGETWARHGFALESSRHYISAESWDNAVFQLTEALPEMWAVGESRFVLSLMEMIPPNSASLDFLLYKVRFLRSAGRYEDAIACASEVQDVSQRRGLDEYARRAEVLILQTHRYFGSSVERESDLATKYQAETLNPDDVLDFELGLQSTYARLVSGELLQLVKQLSQISRVSPPVTTYLGARYGSLLGFAQAWALGRPDRAVSTLWPVADFFCNRDYEQYCQNLANIVKATAELDADTEYLEVLLQRIHQIESNQSESHSLALCSYVGNLEHSVGNVEYAQSQWKRALEHSTFHDQYEAALSLGWVNRLSGDPQSSVTRLIEFRDSSLYRSIELRYQVELAMSEWHLIGNTPDERLLESVEAECRAGYQRYALVHCLHAQGVERHYSGDGATSLRKLRESVSISKLGDRQFWLRAEAQADPAPLSQCLRNDVETEFLAPILVRAGEPVARHLARTIADWKPEEKIRALEVMGSIGDRKSVGALRREALSSDEPVRQAARDAINKVSLEVNGAVQRLKVGLTSREADVLALLADGESNGEIANGLFLSASTVKTYVNRIFHKLGVPTRMQAAKRYNDAIAEDVD